MTYTPDTINDGLPLDEPRELWRYIMRRPGSTVVYRDVYDGPIFSPVNVPYGNWEIEVHDELNEVTPMFQTANVTTTDTEPPEVVFNQTTRYHTTYNIYDNKPTTDRYYELVPVFQVPSEDFQRFGGYIYPGFILVNVRTRDEDGAVYWGNFYYRYYSVGSDEAAQTDQNYQPAEPYHKNGCAILCAIQRVITDGVPVYNQPIQRFTSAVSFNLTYDYDSGGSPLDTVQPKQSGVSKTGYRITARCIPTEPDEEPKDEPDTEYIRELVLIALTALAALIAALIVFLAAPEIVGVGSIAAAGEGLAAAETLVGTAAAEEAELLAAEQALIRAGEAVNRVLQSSGEAARDAANARIAAEEAAKEVTQWLYR